MKMEREQSFRLIIDTYYVMCIQTIPSAIFLHRPAPQQAKLLEQMNASASKISNVQLNFKIVNFLTDP